MTEMQVRLGNALLKALVGLKETKKHLNIEDVGALFEHMAQSLPRESSADMFIRKEIEKIANYISQALEEIASITPEDPPHGEEELHNIKNINYASSELAAVVEATEKATNDILDAADQIQEIVNSIDGHDVHKQQLVEASMKIYDACNFQDITGQRIGKVVRTLDYLNTKISKLKSFIEESSVELDSEIDEEFQDKRPDAHLMSGPQLPNSAPDQDAIDRLFASS